MAVTLIQGCQCNRPSCGHKWTPRPVPRRPLPKICPKCKSERWDKPSLMLVFAIAGWDFKARLVDMQSRLRFRSNGGLVIDVVRVKMADEVLNYPATSATLVLFTNNWHVQKHESKVAAMLAADGYACVTESEFTAMVERVEI